MSPERFDPLDEPNAKEITRVVLRFASANQMKSECLFAGLPVWHLAWPGGEQFGLARENRIQLTLYLMGEDQWISILPTYELGNRDGFRLVLVKCEADREPLSTYCGARGRIDDGKLFEKLDNNKIIAENLIYERSNFMELGGRED